MFMATQSKHIQLVTQCDSFDQVPFIDPRAVPDSRVPLRGLSVDRMFLLMFPKHSPGAPTVKLLSLFSSEMPIGR